MGSLPALVLTNRNTKTHLLKINLSELNNPPPDCLCPPTHLHHISSMRAVPLLLLASLLAIASGYQWEPVLSDSFPWRPCSSFEATKKNCPKGEPCMADLSYAGYVPNNALKCQRSRDRLLEQYQNAKIG